MKPLNEMMTIAIEVNEQLNNDKIICLVHQYDPLKSSNPYFWLRTNTKSVYPVFDSSAEEILEAAQVMLLPSFKLVTQQCISDLIGSTIWYNREIECTVEGVFRRKGIMYIETDQGAKPMDECYVKEV